VRGRYDEIRAPGGEVVVVSPGRPEALAAYLDTHRWPFPVVVDPSRESYRRFGLGRTSWRTFFRPSVLGRYVRLMLRGWLPHRAYDREDLLQLGGDFVLDAQRRLVFAYPSLGPTDRPTAQALVDAVRAASKF
jgi:peroxiredoxin